MSLLGQGQGWVWDGGGGSLKSQSEGSLLVAPWGMGDIERWGPAHPVSPTGRCWLDALELALRCSSLLRLGTCKPGRDGEPGTSPDASPSSLCGLPTSATVHPDQDLFP